MILSLDPGIRTHMKRNAIEKLDQTIFPYPIHESNLFSIWVWTKLSWNFKQRNKFITISGNQLMRKSHPSLFFIKIQVDCFTDTLSNFRGARFMQRDSWMSSECMNYTAIGTRNLGHYKQLSRTYCHERDWRSSFEFFGLYRAKKYRISWLKYQNSGCNDNVPKGKLCRRRSCRRSS